MGIGKRIKEARIKNGLTQEDLAKAIGVTKGAIANYELETSHPKEPVMYALINALGVEPNFLFQDCVNLSLKEKAPLYSSEAMKLAQDYDALDSYGKNVVRLVADAEKARCVEQSAPSSVKLYIAARDGSRIEAEVDDDAILPESDTELPE